MLSPATGLQCIDGKKMDGKKIILFVLSFCRTFFCHGAFCLGAPLEYVQSGDRLAMH
jgi:hypothetical protein